MGEVIGSRTEWLRIAFLVENDRDHDFLLETVKVWEEWKSPSLYVVYVSLEREF